MAQTKATAEPATTRPSRDVPGEGTDRVFIAPRVIDQGAFDDCAGQLRVMLETAEERTAELQAAIGQAAQAHQAALEQQSRQRSQLELVTRLLKALTAKGEQVNATLGRIEARADRVEQFETRARELLDELSAQAAASKQPSATPNVTELVERGEAMRTEIDLSIKRLTLLRDDARAAARELATTLGNVLEAMEDLPALPKRGPADSANATGDLTGEMARARSSMQAFADRFRKDIAGDLSKMAAAMRLIANRAETHVRLGPESDEPTEVIIRVRDHEPGYDVQDHSPVSPGTPLS
ncbi:MAG: hypothetical protein KDA20_00935 [Phycisphaerales bacterium]|nr:hypothetical protein [Phycisphaerales bacterium]